MSEKRKDTMKLKMTLVILLLMSLSLTACLGGRGGSLAGVSLADGADTASAAPEVAAAEVAGQFLAACLAGDMATALDLLTADIRQAVVLTGGYPCSSIPAEAAAAVYLTTETVGQTTTVTHTWARESGATVYLRLLLREEAGLWRIFDAHRDYVQPTPEPRPTPLSPPYTQPLPP
jgi:hypothetical protein